MSKDEKRSATNSVPRRDRGEHDSRSDQQKPSSERDKFSPLSPARQDELLDEALDETFPASDPVAPPQFD